MNKDLQAKLNRTLKEHNAKRKWLSIVISLCVVVAGITTYALINPADTQTGKTYCGYEEHAEHCEECYEEIKTLICPLSEEGHIHSESCYESVLTCGKEETDGHQHSADCFTLEPVLTCENTDETHVHSDECYEMQEVLVCTEPEVEPHHHDESCFTSNTVCGMEEREPHQHSEECYEINRDHLICELPIHEHTLQCFSNPDADVETASVWERTLGKVELSGNWNEDVLAIAKSQLGYTESTANYEVQEDGTTMKGYTRYGDWYGNAYGDWCAMFCSFCMNYAEVDHDLIPLEASCQRWIDKLSDPEIDLYHPVQNEKSDEVTTFSDEQEEEKYIPAPGDLVFFDWDRFDQEHPENRSADHVGIVAELTYDKTTNEIKKIKTIEGNSGDCVRYNIYDYTDSSILGYGEMPENPESVRTIESQPASDGAVAVISGTIPENAQAEIQPVPLSEEELISYFGADKAAQMTGYVSYDIRVTVDGEEWQPSKTVGVTVRNPELNLGSGAHLGLAHVDDSINTVRDIAVRKDETDEIFFETDGFSVYILYTSLAGSLDNVLSDGVYVIAASDFQDDLPENEANGNARMDALLATVDENFDSNPYAFLFGGDYSRYPTSEAQTHTEPRIQDLDKIVTDRFGDIERVYIMGNHDYPSAPSLASQGEHDTPYYGAFVINYSTFPDGSESDQRNLAAQLEGYLKDKADAGYTKPVFVLTHSPFHFSSRIKTDDAKYAKLFYDACYKYGDSLNIIVLVAHNHSSTYDDYLGGSAFFFTDGDELPIPDDGSTTKFTKRPLNFTYMNYGYVGFYGAGSSSSSAKRTPDYMTVSTFEIEESTVYVKRWNVDGAAPLKKAGTNTTTYGDYTWTVGSTYTLTAPASSTYTFVDTTTGITASALASGLQVEDVTGNVSANDVAEAYTAYQITVNDLSGTVDISIPVPENSGYDTVWQLEEGGTLVPVTDAVLADGMISFTTENGSGTYVVGMRARAHTVDEATGVMVEANGTALTVHILGSSDKLDAMNVTDYRVYDIKVSDFTGTATVYLPLEEGHDSVWYLGEDEQDPCEPELQDITICTIDGVRYAEFETSHFSDWGVGTVNVTYWQKLTALDQLNSTDTYMIVRDNYALAANSSHATLSGTNAAVTIQAVTGADGVYTISGNGTFANFTWKFDNGSSDGTITNRGTGSKIALRSGAVLNENGNTMTVSYSNGEFNIKRNGNNYRLIESGGIFSRSTNTTNAGMTIYKQVDEPVINRTVKTGTGSSTVYTVNVYGIQVDSAGNPVSTNTEPALLGTITVDSNTTAANPVVPSAKFSDLAVSNAALTGATYVSSYFGTNDSVDKNNVTALYRYGNSGTRYLGIKYNNDSDTTNQYLSDSDPKGLYVKYTMPEPNTWQEGNNYKVNVYGIHVDDYGNVLSETPILLDTVTIYPTMGAPTAISDPYSTNNNGQPNVAYLPSAQFLKYVDNNVVSGEYVGSYFGQFIDGENGQPGVRIYDTNISQAIQQDRQDFENAKGVTAPSGIPDGVDALFSTQANGQYYLGVRYQTRINNEQNNTIPQFIQGSSPEALYIMYTDKQEPSSNYDIEDGKAPDHRKYIDSFRDGEENPDTELDDTAEDLTDLYRVYLDVGPETSYEPIDVLIMLDLSNSMNNTGNSADAKDLYGNTTSRLNALWGLLYGMRQSGDYTTDTLNVGSNGKEGLLKKIIDMNPENNIAVSFFSEKAENGIQAGSSGSTNLSEYHKNVIDWFKAADWTDGKITRFLPPNGTNYTAAMIKMQDMLKEAEKANPERQKIVIFVSDGEPNYFTYGYGGNFDEGVTGKVFPAGTSPVELSHFTNGYSTVYPYDFYDYVRYWSSSSTPSADGYEAAINAITYFKGWMAQQGNITFNTIAIGSTSYFFLDEMPFGGAKFFTTDFSKMLRNMEDMITRGAGTYTAIEVDDTISDDVELYVSNASKSIDDPVNADLKISMTPKGGDEIVLYQNHTLTTDGANHIDSWSIDQENGEYKTITVKYKNVDNPLLSGAKFTVSFNIKTKQVAYDNYADNIKNSGGLDDELNGYLGNIGEDDTDFDGNETSSLKPGWNANNHNAGEANLTGKAELHYKQIRATDSQETPMKTAYYDHPVVQVWTTELEITKEWSDGNEEHEGESVTVEVWMKELPTHDPNNPISPGAVTDPSVRAGGGNKIATVTLSDENDWTYTLEGLPRGYYYYILEQEDEAFSDYEKVYQPSAVAVPHFATGEYDFAVKVTNTKNPKYLVLKKTDMAGNPLEGATFKLYSDEGHTQEVHANELIVSGSDGVFTPANFTLDNGTYYLVEIDAPPGYNRLTDHIILTVADTGITAHYNGSPLSVTSETSSDGTTVTYTLPIANSSGYELPETGGIGQYPIYTLGVLLIAGSLMCGYKLRRRRERRTE